MLGENAAPARHQVQAAFATVAGGATDVSDRLRADIGTLLYAAHLLMVLYWLQDRTPDQRATRDLIGFAEETLGRLHLLLRIPLIARLLRAARCLARVSTGDSKSREKRVSLDILVTSGARRQGAGKSSR